MLQKILRQKVIQDKSAKDRVILQLRGLCSIILFPRGLS